MFAINVGLEEGGQSIDYINSNNISKIGFSSKERRLKLNFGNNYV